MVQTKIERFKMSQKINRLIIVSLNSWKKLETISSSFTKYRPIAFIEKQSELNEV